MRSVCFFSLASGYSVLFLTIKYKKTLAILNDMWYYIYSFRANLLKDSDAKLWCLIGKTKRQTGCTIRYCGNAIDAAAFDFTRKIY